jgi:hypothetical protein
LANVFAIHSVGQSIADYLSKTYPPTLSGPHPCQFRVVASAEMMQSNEFANTTVSIYLYRITVNEFLRGAARAVAPNDVNIPLSLDLHYLITAWADDFLTEHLIMAWTLRQLYYRQTLTAAELSPEADWGPSDVITLLPAEMSMPDMMRLWDVFEPKYRLSVTYVARAVRIDTDLDVASYQPVVSRRNQYENKETT